MGFVVLPLWIAAGFADYLCHRASQIQDNSGAPESALHLLQYALVGLPVTFALFSRPNAGFFVLAVFCIILHHAVAYIDVRYAASTREVAPVEQMIHSFLELLPITAFLLLGMVEWTRFQALFFASEVGRFSWEPRVISASFNVIVLGAACLFNLIPYVEELMRCLRAPRKG